MFKLIIEDKQGGVADEYTFEEGEFIVGRSHSADIILPSDNVSRRHVRIYTVDGQCYVEDMKSANGVFVNGRRIHEVHQVQQSAQVRVGDFYLNIETAEAEGVGTFLELQGHNLVVADQTFRIEQMVTLVGRGKDCSVTVIDPSVSRIHAKLTVDRSGCVTLEDLKSSNGTFVNDSKIDVHTLNHGDRLRFGNVEFTVHFPSGSEDGPTDLEAEEPEAHEDDEQWGEFPRRSPVWAFVGLALVLLLAIGIVYWLAGDVLDSTSEDAEKARVERPVDEGKARRTREALAGYRRVAEGAMENRRWDDAMAAWNDVIDLDPVNERARRATNQITIWKKHKQWLSDAEALSRDKSYEDAVKLLRRIDAESEYHEDAQQALASLAKIKPSLLKQADALLASRDCEGALLLLRQAKQLDPRDPEIDARIQDTEKRKRKKKKCRRR